MRHRLVKWLARGQGAYFLITGIWPLVHMPSFLWVTGDKAELWLVETVGVLVIAIGLCLVLTRPDPLPPREVMVAAITASLGLAIIEVVYVSKGTISPIYLLDAIVEGAIVILWIYLWVSLGARRT